MKVSILGVGLYGVGIDSWQAFEERLGGKRQAHPPTPPKPELIPARERRRAPLAVKHAVEVATQACEAANMAPSEPACVFASAMGDLDITDYMCRTLAGENTMISPTKFHNSVHNAPVGYWSISGGSMAAANSVSAFDYTASVALMEAISHCVEMQQAVLLVVQDIAAPPIFKVLRSIENAFAGALLIAPNRPDTPTLAASISTSGTDWPAPALPDELSDTYQSNPAARMLALYAALNRGNDHLRLPMSEKLTLNLTLEGLTL
ncbi:MAG: hypothetical protein DHS20C11_33200 [Lysobacteraceae bacterium]|nr:MAG: hypothetical protein DHS20C11_33200 [Xanthomonadaceae bacterium]